MSDATDNPTDLADRETRKAIAVAFAGDTRELSVFSSNAGFTAGQRMAQMLSASTIVPEAYRNNVSNCLVALEFAQRLGTSPLLVMQNLHVINGKPGWSAQYIIASINTCRKFSPLRFRIEGDGQERKWTAIATELATGETLEGPTVSMAMAKAEGWTKNAKWNSMPDVMGRYRAAAFFGRIYAPEIMMGLQTSEEIQDVIEGTATVVQRPQGVPGQPNRLMAAVGATTGEPPAIVTPETSGGVTEPKDAGEIHDAEFTDKPAGSTAAPIGEDDCPI